MTALPPAIDIPILTSIAPLSEGRRAWLVDIWGVMHNGVTPFLPAAEACLKFRNAGGTVLLLSNAPRPADAVRVQLDRIGVPRSAYDAILSSGDAARELISEAVAAGQTIGHLGPERDLPLFAGLGQGPGPLDAAQTVVCSGLFDDERETPADYAAILSRLAGRGAKMICANPDLTVERGGRIIYCAGALAQAYEALGGEVAYAGKPYAPVYRLAFKHLHDLRGETLREPDVLAIGDGVMTDIAGAAGAGIDAVYVASGVHLGPGGVLDAASLRSLFEHASLPNQARPVAAMAGLRW